MISNAEYWRKQANLWAAQEKAWHDTVVFCRKMREEIKKIRIKLLDASR